MCCVPLSAKLLSMSAKRNTIRMLCNRLIFTSGTSGVWLSRKRLREPLSPKPKPKPKSLPLHDGITTERTDSRNCPSQIPYFRLTLYYPCGKQRKKQCFSLFHEKISLQTVSNPSNTASSPKLTIVNTSRYRPDLAPSDFL